MWGGGEMVNEIHTGSIKYIYKQSAPVIRYE